MISLNRMIQIINDSRLSAFLQGDLIHVTAEGVTLFTATADEEALCEELHNATINFNIQKFADKIVRQKLKNQIEICFDSDSETYKNNLETTAEQFSASECFLIAEQIEGVLFDLEDQIYSMN